MINTIKSGDYVLIARRGSLQNTFACVESLVWDRDSDDYNITLKFLDGTESDSWTEDDLRLATDEEIDEAFPPEKAEKSESLTKKKKA